MNTPAEEARGLPPPVTTTRRLFAAAEVVFAALGGTLLAQAVWLAMGFDGGSILSSADLLAPFLMLDATMTLVIVWLLLRLQGEPLSMIGFRRRKSFLREASIGVMLLPVFLASVAAVGLFFQVFLPHLVTTENPILDLIQSPRDVLLFLLSSVYVGGIKEEVQRAFALTRFEEYLGGAPAGLLIWSTLFGLGHATQGIDNALKAGVLGLGFGVLYLWRRDPAAAIVSHATWDVVTVLLIWLIFRA